MTGAPETAEPLHLDHPAGRTWRGALPALPEPARLWRSLRWWVWTLVALLVLRAVPLLLVDYWFFESLGRVGVYWTNLLTQAGLFLVGGTALALSVRMALGKRPAANDLALWTGILGGWLLAGRYLDFLLAMGGGRFGETDPVFGHDVGLYVFYLPALRHTLTLVICCGIVGAIAALAGRWSASRQGDRTTRYLRFNIILSGAALALRTFLSRYDLLLADNEASGVRIGADYLDVTGFFSTLHLLSLSAFVELGLAIALCWALQRLRPAVVLALGLLALELGMYLGVVVRDHVFVAPNAPTIQVPYIRRHMDATLRGYRLDRVRTVPWSLPAKPLSSAELQASATARKAPILPGWVSSLEEPPDVQHFERVQATGSTLVYGPMLQIFEQEQQLRPYYHFVSVDPVRYPGDDGQLRMYVSAVRELPSLAFLGPKEWLRYWGSAALMYTHGFGLVMSPADEVDSTGSPRYAARDVPPVLSDRRFESEPRIYFGEGAKDDYILTNLSELREFDHATRQSRSEFVFPGEATSGIRVSSLFRRLVLAAYTGDVTAFLFSRFIDPERTRIHLYRTPLRRIRRLAPFLFLDSNPYAFIADRRVLWMVNGLTTTDRYPYSFRERLGDKADERAIEPFPERTINYAEDAVKATVDAFSGEVHYYQMAGDPIVQAWARVYPGFFESRAAMPAPVSAQLTYPLQWFHVQFDDIYKRYHQRDPLEFYNVEDLWDDADEVLGSIGRGLTEFGTTDQMTFSYEGHPLLVDPADLPPGSDLGPPNRVRFVLLMPFTPEGARNLRSVILAVQDPDRYGELLSLQFPQGSYVPGPEQADAFIDNDAQVNQQITLWVRHGSEVVRGHTLLLPVRGDLLYLEPLWIVSLQNQLPQAKLFSVVYRGRTTMATSPLEAIRMLGISENAEQEANELPWFRRPERTDTAPRLPSSQRRGPR